MKILEGLVTGSKSCNSLCFFAFCIIHCILLFQRSGFAFVRSSQISNLRSSLSRTLMSTMSTATTRKGESDSPVSREFSNYTDSLQFYHALRSCNDQYISTHLNKALDSLSDALRLYGPNRIFSSYNGGKDADVIMHLLRAVFAKYSDDKRVDAVPEMVYFVNSDEFDEVTEHIARSQQLYNLKITTYDNGIVHVSVELLTETLSIASCL